MRFFLLGVECARWRDGGERALPSAGQCQGSCRSCGSSV